MPILVLIMEKTKSPQFYVISDAGPDLAGFAVYDALGALVHCYSIPLMCGPL